MTLGGGLELCLGCDAVQAAAETYAGLVEVGVGLIPGGAGCLNMVWRALEGIPEGAEVDRSPLVAQVFKNIATGQRRDQRGGGQRRGLLPRRATASRSTGRASCGEAKRAAVGLARPATTRRCRALPLPGESGIATLEMLVDTLVAGGYATEHDAVIARKLAAVLCGGAAGATHEVTEDEMLELEREAFVSLCGEPQDARSACSTCS